VREASGEDGGSSPPGNCWLDILRQFLKSEAHSLRLIQFVGGEEKYKTEASMPLSMTSIF